MDHKRIPRIYEEEIKKPNIKLHIKKRTVSLNELNALEPKKQYDYIKDILNEIYKNKIKIDRKMVLKCISLTCSKEDIKNFLPFGLVVEKKRNNLIFKTENKRNAVLLLIFINILAFAMISASYSAIDYLSKIDLNKDIDGDGIPDINLDINNDEKAEINIDTNKDDVPDINIDYKGNKKSIFNIDSNEDNKADKNLVVKAKNRKCKKEELNCDINDDGWPDVNLDLNGDGIADIDIDTNEDGIIDLNIDTNRDGLCNINCDTNNDWKCDEYCINLETIIIPEIRPGSSTGTSSVTGNPGLEVGSAQTSLYIEFVDSVEVIAKNIFPDDQPGMNTTIPNKVFTIENKTGVTQYYNISWIVTRNTFISDHLMFKVESTNGGGTLDYTTYPKTNHIFLSNISIAPYVTQTYTISSKLHGINAPQNEDQDKEFIGKIQIEAAI